MNRTSLASLIAVATFSSGAVAAFVACSSGTPVDPGSSESEKVGTSQQPLLSTACSPDAGTLTLTIAPGEVGYISKTAGCPGDGGAGEPCVWANGTDSLGNRCAANSTKSITVVGAGNPEGGVSTEKVVFDFSNGLFAAATDAGPLIHVTLDNPDSGAPVSKVMVIPPSTGGNIAMGATDAGVNQVDLNALSPRAAVADMVIQGASGDVNPAFEFSGGTANDIVTGDVGGWPTGDGGAPALKGWTSGIATTLGWSPTNLPLTLSGGAGNDILAGGAGSNTLLGGAGNDTFFQSTTPNAEVMMGGDGVDTVDYGNRSAAVYVTPHSNTGIATMVVPAAGGNGGTGYQDGDIVTVSGGTGGLLATLQVSASSGVVTGAVVVNAGDGYTATTGIATTDVTTPAASGLTIDIATLGANDGVSGEGDDVQFDVEIVNGGSGNDVLNAHGIASTDVVLMGNGGNDQLTGGGGNDDLCGGAGNDTFYDNAGNDYLVGGAGTDTADYSTGTSVVACLGAADQAVLDAGSKTCSAQNGGTFSGHAEKDIVNVVTTATAKVCPRASLNIANAGTTAAGTPTTPGGAMAIDVENLTGHPTNANTLLCGTVPCTVMGGSGNDTLAGGASNDQIYGNGGSDTVSTNGGNDLVDLTHAQITGSDGGLVSATDTVNCANAAVTILTSSGDTLVQATQTVTTDAGMVTTNTCINANIP